MSVFTAHGFIPASIISLDTSSTTCWPVCLLKGFSWNVNDCETQIKPFPELPTAITINPNSAPWPARLWVRSSAHLSHSRAHYASLHSPLPATLAFQLLDLPWPLLTSGHFILRLLPGILSPQIFVPLASSYLSSSRGEWLRRTFSNHLN